MTAALCLGALGFAGCGGDDGGDEEQAVTSASDALAAEELGRLFEMYDEFCTPTGSKECIAFTEEYCGKRGVRREALQAHGLQRRPPGHDQARWADRVAAGGHRRLSRGSCRMELRLGKAGRARASRRTNCGFPAGGPAPGETQKPDAGSWMRGLDAGR